MRETPEVREEIRRRLASFEHIAVNRFLCERKFNKQSRGMECDCTPVGPGKRGCGDDCLNRYGYGGPITNCVNISSLPCNT